MPIDPPLIKLSVVLQPVRLSKLDTCLTYALKRSGHDIPELQDSQDVELYFLLEPFHSFQALARGDILSYCDRERYATMPDEITAEGKIIFHRRLVLRHFAVYEGNGMISDCTISSQDYPFAKTIRMQRAVDVSTFPNHILKRKL